MKLFVIGNGFDLRHGLETGYCNYRDFLLKQPEGENLLTFIRDDEKLPCFNVFGDLFWKEVENNLRARLNQLLLQTIEGLGFPDPNDLSLYESFTGSLFEKWVDSIKVKEKEPIHPRTAFKDSIFLTFNYTKTLELLYGVPEEKVLHVHGVVGKDVLQFGNSSFAEDVKTNTFKSDEFAIDYLLKHRGAAFSFDEVDSYSDKALSVFGKDVTKNKSIIQDFLKPHMSVIDKIIFLGFGFGEQDEGYWNGLFKELFGSFVWLASELEKEAKNLKAKLESRGIKAEIDVMDSIIGRI